MKTKLTLKNVAAATPQVRPYEIRDTDVKGLLLRIQPSGVKVFYVEWARGKRTALKPRYPTLTLDAARTKAHEILLDADKKGTPTAHRHRRRKGEQAHEEPNADIKTWNDFIDRRYGPWKIANKKSGAADIAALKAQFEKLYGRKPLSEITAWSFERFRVDRLKDGVAAATINRDYERLRAALNKAVEWDLLPANPISKVKKTKVDNERIRYLTSEEEKRLRTALLAREAERRTERESGRQHRIERDNPEKPPLPMWKLDQFSDHLPVLVLTALNTGLRRGELLGLTWDRVNFGTKQITVSARTAKSGKVRHIPLNAEALDTLQRWHKYRTDDVQVFPGRATAQITHFNKSWRSVVTAAALSDFRFHDCRHDFASKLVMSGVDLYSVKELLGHSDFKQTRRYAHLSPEHMQAAVEKLVRR